MYWLHGRVDILAGTLYIIYGKVSDPSISLCIRCMTELTFWLENYIFCGKISDPQDLFMYWLHARIEIWTGTHYIFMVKLLIDKYLTAL